MSVKPNKHKYQWEGNEIVTAVASKCNIGQRSGLLYANERNRYSHTLGGPMVLEHKGGEFIQRGDETPLTFWKRVLAAVGEDCPTCGKPLTEASK